MEKVQVYRKKGVKRALKVALSTFKKVVLFASIKGL